MHFLLRVSLVLMLVLSVGSPVFPGLFCKLFSTCQDSGIKGHARIASAELSPDASLDLPDFPAVGEDADSAMAFGETALNSGLYYSIVSECLSCKHFKSISQAIWLLNQNIRL